MWCGPRAPFFCYLVGCPRALKIIHVYQTSALSPSPALRNLALPTSLVISQTTFLNHLLGEDFPGMHIGPEPTTDKFMALFHGGDDGPVDPADARAVDPAGFLRRRDGRNERRNDHDRDGGDDDGGGSTSRSVVTDDVTSSGRLVKGNTLTVTPNLPFSSLSQFGSAFLNHFVGSSSGAPLLRRITFVDTPGVLSGEKQRINRTYDFGQVAKWFADR